MFIYTTRDTNTGSFDDEANFGLFETDWTKKAAADTVANLITDLADGTAEPFGRDPIPPDPAVPASGRHLASDRSSISCSPFRKYVLQTINSVAIGVVTRHRHREVDRQDG